MSKDPAGPANSSVCPPVNASSLLASVHRAYLLPLLAKHDRNIPLRHEDLLNSHAAGRKVLIAAIVEEGKGGSGNEGADELKAAEQGLSDLHNSQIQAYEVAARSALTRRASVIAAALACENVSAPYNTHANELEGQYTERCTEAAIKDPQCAGWKVDSKVLEECVSSLVREAARRRWKEGLKEEKVSEDIAAKVRAEENPLLSSVPSKDKDPEKERVGDRSTAPVEEFDDEAHADDEDDGEDEDEDEDATDHDGVTEEDEEDDGAGDNDNDDDEQAGENGKDGDDEGDISGAVPAVAAPKRPRIVRLGGHKTASSKAGAAAMRKRKLGGGGADASKLSGGNGVTGGAAPQGNKRRRNIGGGSGGRSRSGRGRGRRPRGGAGRSGA